MINSSDVTSIANSAPFRNADLVLSGLGSSYEGISHKEAEHRLSVFGRNQLEQQSSLSPLKIFLNQFKSSIVAILIFALFASALLGEYTDAAVIMAILILNAILGFVQEFRAEKAIQDLKKMAAPKAKVLRGGKLKLVDSSILVPGDVILLEEGDKVPADARIIESSALQVQESSLTGESMPVSKSPSPVSQGKTSIQDWSCMVFSSTIVTRGKAKA
ncbi:ATPase, partial [Candidatus Woesearchaeota archaeon]